MDEDPYDELLYYYDQYPLVDLEDQYDDQKVIYYSDDEEHDIVTLCKTCNIKFNAAKFTGYTLLSAMLSGVYRGNERKKQRFDITEYELVMSWFHLDPNYNINNHPTLPLMRAALYAKNDEVVNMFIYKFDGNIEMSIIYTMICQAVANDEFSFLVWLTSIKEWSLPIKTGIVGYSTSYQTLEYFLRNFKILSRVEQPLPSIEDLYLNADKECKSLIRMRFTKSWRPESHFIQHTNVRKIIQTLAIIGRSPLKRDLESVTHFQNLPDELLTIIFQFVAATDA